MFEKEALVPQTGDEEEKKDGDAGNNESGRDSERTISNDVENAATESDK